MKNFTTITGVIRMRSLGLSFPSCQERFHIGSGTAQDIMSKYKKMLIPLEELETMEPQKVEQLFYPSIQRKHRKIPDPPFDEIFEHLHITGRSTLKKDIWEEYQRREPDGYRRSQFYEYLNEYLLDRFGPDDLTMGVNRIPGERVFIDYCGDKPLVHIFELSKDPSDITEQQKIHLFLTTCGFSSKLYGEASLNEKQYQFNGATANALKYYGAVPRYLVPDNLKTGVTVNTKDQVLINSSFQDLEAFFDVIVLPPPYRKPKGKAAVERYVQVIEKKVIAKLEKQYTFQNLEEVNSAVMEVIEEENNKKPKGYRLTHNELFEMYDKPAMRPLTDTEFMNCDYGYCPSVPDSYHVAFDEHFYSVPYHYYGKEVLIKASMDKVMLCDANNHLIVEHKRCYIPTLRFITKEEHMPANHRFYSEVNHLDSSDYLKWAEEIGTNMKQLIYAILKSAKHDDQMYRACNSIRHMCADVPKGLCEEAAADCMRSRRTRYSDFKETLGDLLKMRRQSSITATLPEADDAWGKDYYG